jgi:TetR/AcrR family transcriptional regulator, transcriptional repressor for nem operon
MFDKYVKIGLSLGVAMAGVRQFDEEVVLDRALEVFRRKGLRATSMLDLARATGVQRGSLYHAYGGKEALFRLAFLRYGSRFLAAAASALDRPDARSALRRFFTVIVANMTAGVPSRGCFTTKTAVESASGQAVRTRLRELLDELHGIVAAALSRPATRKDLVVQPEDAAHIVVTFTRGLAVMERVYRDRERLSETAEALVEALVRRETTRERNSSARIGVDTAARG